MQFDQSTMIDHFVKKGNDHSKTNNKSNSGGGGGCIDYYTNEGSHDVTFTGQFVDMSL